MDDLDRTFQRLRRSDFETLRDALQRAADADMAPGNATSKGFYTIINAMTFEATLARPYWHICAEHGWTVDEFNYELMTK